MRITQVSYGKTFNTGNYTSERFDLSASVDEGEDHRAVLLDLQCRVAAMGGDQVGMNRAKTMLRALESGDPATKER